MGAALAAAGSCLSVESAARVSLRKSQGCPGLPVGGPQPACGAGGKLRPTRGRERAFGSKGTPRPPSALQEESEQTWPSCDHVSQVHPHREAVGVPVGRSLCASGAPPGPVGACPRQSVGPGPTRHTGPVHTPRAAYPTPTLPGASPQTVSTAADRQLRKGPHAGAGGLHYPAHLRPGNQSWAQALLAPTLYLRLRHSAQGQPRGLSFLRLLPELLSTYADIEMCTDCPRPFNVAHHRGL